MNKKIIALAVATAFAAPMAANAGVTVYGKINVGIASTDNGASTGPSTYMGVQDEASRLGFKASEDLGNGMTAFVKYEGTLDADGTGFSMNRDKFIGLKSSFGTIRAGRMNTAYKNATGKMDIFADSIGDITGDGTHGKLDNRHDNMLSYTNTNGSLSFGVDFLFSEADGTGSKDDGLSAALTWKDKGFMASVAIVDQDDNDSGVGGLYTEGVKLGFQMKLGAGKLNIIHEATDNTGTVDPTATTIQYGMNMGKNMLGVSYTMVDGDSVDNDSSQITVGYHMKLSKKTKVAFAYTTVDNDTNATASGRIFNKGLGSESATAGDDPSTLGVMVTHKF